MIAQIRCRFRARWPHSSPDRSVKGSRSARRSTPLEGPVAGHQRVQHVEALPEGPSCSRGDRPHARCSPPEGRTQSSAVVAPTPAPDQRQSAGCCRSRIQWAPTRRMPYVDTLWSSMLRCRRVRVLASRSSTRRSRKSTAAIVAGSEQRDEICGHAHADSDERYTKQLSDRPAQRHNELACLELTHEQSPFDHGKALHHHRQYHEATA